MPMTPEVKAAAELYLLYLEGEAAQIQQQLAPLQAKQKELFHTINNVSKTLSPTLTQQPKTPTPIRTAGAKYTYISVRWAILDLLSGSLPMTTAEIADALRQNGVRTKAANFVNNVSAVLTSTTRPPHQEVEQLADSKWQLNQKGREAIDHIRTTPKFRRACA